MSQNNLIRKSDKKFIRTEKARIRSQFLDSKKQEELIDSLYKKFSPQEKIEESITQEPKKVEVKKEPALAKALAHKEKPEVKKEKKVKAK